MNDNIPNILDHLEDSIVSRLEDNRSPYGEIIHLLDIEYDECYDPVLTPEFSIVNNGTVLEYPRGGPLPGEKLDCGTARKGDKKCKNQRTDSYYPPGTRIHSDTSAFVASVFKQMKVRWNRLINKAHEDDEDDDESVPIRVKIMDHILVFYQNGGGVVFTANSYAYISRLKTEEENCAKIKARIVNLLKEVQKSVDIVGPP